MDRTNKMHAITKQDIDKTCRNCYFSDFHTDTSKERESCHLNPPIPLPTPTTSSGYKTMYSQVRARDWCGQWQDYRVSH